MAPAVLGVRPPPRCSSLSQPMASHRRMYPLLQVNRFKQPDSGFSLHSSSSSFKFYYEDPAKTQQSVPLRLTLVGFPAGGQAEPTSAGDVPADSDNLAEDGEEGEEAGETISKEEAAERLMVGQSPRNHI